MKNDSKPSKVRDDDASEKEQDDSCFRRMPVIGPIVRLYDRYDASFLTMLGVQYFNQGTNVLIYRAASQLFKEYFKMEPGAM